VNTVWIVCGIAVAAVIIVFLRLWQKREEPSDMGAVSNQWVAEHRLGQLDDRQR